MSDTSIDTAPTDLEAIVDALTDSASSYWLRSALTHALERDPVDAAKDAAKLSTLLSARASNCLGRVAHSQAAALAHN